jgi:hypothetical protein
MGFLVEPQNQGLWFGLKTGGDGFLRFGLKTSGDDFSQFGLKTGGDGFSLFGLKTGGLSVSVWASKPAVMVWLFDNKITATVFLFGPQNQAGTVCRLRHKTDGRMESTRGMRQNIVAA